MKENWNKLKEQFSSLGEKIRPIKDAIFNRRLASALRITYSVIWNLLLILIICLTLIGVLAAGVGMGYFASLVKDEVPRTYEELRKDIYNYEEPSEVYFAGGIHMGTMRSDIIREEISLDQVSPYVIDAVIATEDQNFYEHFGIVPKSTLRALVQTFTNAATQTGGSTLTQQLIKNQILTNEVSFERKAKEILLAIRVEQFFEKDEILEAYLNVSSFGRNSSGQNIAGVEAAAKGIFGIPAKDLNLPQAAFIAGLPQSPNGYTPFTRAGELKSPEGMQPGLDRQRTVLTRMYETGKITEAEYKAALEYDIVADFIPPQPSVIDKYPFLTFEVEEQAKEILMKFHYEKDGYTEEIVNSSPILKERYKELANRDLRQNGYQIYTTIDKELYEKHQEVVKNFNNYAPDRPEKKKDPETGEEYTVNEPIEVGTVLIENSTGKIVSFVAGRDFDREATNHAFRAERQMGSTMKPLVAYGPAVHLGVASPGTILVDADHGIRVNGRPWPQNYSNRYYGLTSARTALRHSYNVSAVYLLNKVLNAGYNPYEFLPKMGMKSLEGQVYEVPAAALGSPSITVEELTNAFTTFANGGLFIDAYMIEKIEDKDGNVIYEHQGEPVSVFSPQAAYILTDMMRDVIRGGTAGRLPSYLNFNADFAGKTGTSQFTNDITFVGYNPNVTMGIWMGYDTPKSISLNYDHIHLQIWAQLMNVTNEMRPELVGAEDRFNMPGGIVQRTVCGISGGIPSEACKEAGLLQTDLFIEDFLPNFTDDSLISGKYVVIGDKKYLALDSTPEEFVEFGVMLNPDFLKEIAPNVQNLEQLIPNNSAWSNILVPSAKISENGKAPAAISVSLSGNTISWGQHGENDVIGYRIYQVNNGQKGAKVGIVKAGSSLSFNVPGSGQYAVVAVDIAGQESPLSNVVQVGQKEEEKPDQSDENQSESGENDESEQNDNQEEGNE